MKRGKTIICTSCTFMNILRETEDSKQMTSNEITYSLHLVKEITLKYYVTERSNALILKIFHCVITHIFMAILWTLSFVLVLSVKETYFGNYFYFRNQVVRIGGNFSCGRLIGIKPFLYNRT
jgi:hypothetical protein